MADDRKPRSGTAPLDAEIGELDLDGEGTDLEAAMREAMAAVEEVERQTEPIGRPAPAEARSETEVERLGRETETLREQLKRTLADFDNLRKRTERERQELRRFALFDVMREFATVVDNLERAVAASGSADDLKAGVEMILRQMRDLLRRHGVEEIETLGQPFDPALHEAVSREESATVAVPTVVGELQRGYRMHDRLLRPAIVRVAVPAEGRPGEDEGPAL